MQHHFWPSESLQEQLLLLAENKIKRNANEDEYDKRLINTSYSVLIKI